MAVQEQQQTVSPVPLMQLSTGFWAFKTLTAAHDLDLFTRLSATGGMTVDDVVREYGIEERPAEMLLTGCAAIGLLDKAGDSYVNAPLAEEYLPRRRSRSSRASTR